MMGVVKSAEEEEHENVMIRVLVICACIATGLFITLVICYSLENLRRILSRVFPDNLPLFHFLTNQSLVPLMAREVPARDLNDCIFIPPGTPNQYVRQPEDAHTEIFNVSSDVLQTIGRNEDGSTVDGSNVETIHQERSSPPQDQLQSMQRDINASNEPSELHQTTSSISTSADSTTITTTITTTNAAATTTTITITTTTTTAATGAVSKANGGDDDSKNPVTPENPEPSTSGLGGGAGKQSKKSPASSNKKQNKMSTKSPAGLRQTAEKPYDLRRRNTKDELLDGS